MMKLINYKVILQSYCDEHKKKFNEFTVRVILKKNDMILNKISVPCTIPFQKRYMFKPVMEEIPIYEEVSSNKFLDIFNRVCVYNTIVDEKK